MPDVTGFGLAWQAIHGQAGRVCGFVVRITPPMPDKTPFASMSFDIRFMRKGKESALIFLPEPYHAPIGLIIAHWGNFERHFDICLQALIAGEVADGGTREVQLSRQFKRRRALFKEICTEWLAGWRPEEAKSLCQIADTAGDLSWKRNLIAHGQYAYTIPPQSSLATNCRASDTESGKEFSFDADTLVKLYHDISHLTADLVSTFKAFGHVEGDFHTMPDAEVLRTYRETVHPWNPNPKKRPSPVDGGGPADG